MSNIRHIAMLSTVAMATLAGPVMAQDTAPASDPGATAANTTNAPAFGEIVVTANRRAERLQDVPLSVSAVSGAQLATGGFQKLTDLQFQVSGLQFGTSPNDAGFRLRGVGTAGGFSSSSEQNVGTVVDNVIIPFGNPVNSLGDVDRVEALKGPQGTQFGKNASSGVINITTAKPQFDRIFGKAFVSYGSLNEVNANASLNMPVSKDAALAASSTMSRARKCGEAKQVMADAANSCGSPRTICQSTSSAITVGPATKALASSGPSTRCPMT
jgi:iron complex outermembrane receptor protein